MTKTHPKCVCERATEGEGEEKVIDDFRDEMNRQLVERERRRREGKSVDWH
jgi:hypothetical protein